MTPAACEQHHQIALCRLPNSIGRAVGERRVRISRMGGWPKKRLYSRLNWLALSYPTSKAAVAASRPSTSIKGTRQEIGRIGIPHPRHVTVAWKYAEAQTRKKQS